VRMACVWEARELMRWQAPTVTVAPQPLKAI